MEPMTFIVLGNPRPKTRRFDTIMINGQKVCTYTEYLKDAVSQLRVQTKPKIPISKPVNISCQFCRSDNRAVDLGNMLCNVLSMLKKAGIISRVSPDVAASVDGSGVTLNVGQPLTRITITATE